MKPSDKQTFDLHVLLVQSQDGLPAAKARVIAYMEGPAGIKKRMIADIPGPEAQGKN